MNKLMLLCFLLCMRGALFAADLPYDEKADAHKAITHALAQATASDRKVLVIFGANWCADCRELDKALRGSSAPLINGSFVVVKVDIGNFDRHMEIARTYGDPTKKGIPAAVVLSKDNRVLYSTKGGDLADARRMGERGIYNFFSKNIVSVR